MLRVCLLGLLLVHTGAQQAEEAQARQPPSGENRQPEPKLACQDFQFTGACKALGRVKFAYDGNEPASKIPSDYMLKGLDCGGAVETFETDDTVVKSPQCKKAYELYNCANAATGLAGLCKADGTYGLQMCLSVCLAIGKECYQQRTAEAMKYCQQVSAKPGEDCLGKTRSASANYLYGGARRAGNLEEDFDDFEDYGYGPDGEMYAEDDMDGGFY